MWLSSTLKRRDKTTASWHKYRTFLIAYGLLSHSISYLAWSQDVQGIGVSHDESDSDDLSLPGVAIPATSILALLNSITKSPALGQRSHEPGGILLRHLGFGLDVTKVVNFILQAEEVRWGDGVSEGWDLVEDDDLA